MDGLGRRDGGVSVVWRSLRANLPNEKKWFGPRRPGVLAADIPEDVLLSEFAPLYPGEYLRIFILSIGVDSSLAEIAVEDDSTLKSTISPAIPVIFYLYVGSSLIGTYTRYVGFNIAVLASTRKRYLSAGVDA